ncbi:MAG: hypothetical protein OXF56_08795, partial [Rhodobacteraceae bacterium]|nr:hypothetical protein [Paracoccaceae bacterium]
NAQSMTASKAITPLPNAYFPFKNVFPVGWGSFRAGSGDFPGRTSRVSQRTFNVQTQLSSGSVDQPMPVS